MIIQNFSSIMQTIRLSSTFQVSIKRLTISECLGITLLRYVIGLKLGVTFLDLTDTFSYEYRVHLPFADWLSEI